MLVSACNHTSTETTQGAKEHYLSDRNSVGFDIEALPNNGSGRQWLATYPSQGKTAKFRIELDSSSPLNDKESRDFNINFQSGKGKLIAETGSDASVFLADLARALEAKTIPAKPERISSLSFQFVSFGSNQSQAPGGGFRPDPPGNWTPMKLFMGEGKQQGEVFLNLNPVLRKGQFSIKDEEYGDIVVAQLARVL
jgi:hypothetical protein